MKKNNVSFSYRRVGGEYTMVGEYYKAILTATHGRNEWEAEVDAPFAFGDDFWLHSTGDSGEHILIGEKLAREHNAPAWVFDNEINCIGCDMSEDWNIERGVFHSTCSVREEYNEDIPYVELSLDTKKVTCGGEELRCKYWEKERYVCE